MRKRKNINTYSIILNSKRVNYYTKMIILLSNFHYYSDYYIPNKKIMNKLSINKRYTIQILNQLKNDEIINIYYKGNKRYFIFNDKYLEDKKEKLFEYDWLESED